MESQYATDSEPSAEEVAANYRNVLAAMQAAAPDRSVTLVAASKTKSPACLQLLYNTGHRVFGENYVQELVEKAAVLPSDICWHFIGHLQSNKVRELLLKAPTLALVETVDSKKLASRLNTGCARYREGRPLDVFLQVNTSGESSKNGTDPGEPTSQLAEFIARECPLLSLKGLMTIGMPDYTSRPENFTCLIECREDVARVLNVAADTLQLSMGMSGDYVSAVKMGSTTVRVGSSLFGKRFYRPPPTE